jgi:Barstar (barnase inhibitor)
MAPFNQQDEQVQGIDWQILRDGGVALYWRRELFDEDLDWFHQRHYQVYSFDCERWTSSQEMHMDFQRTLNFPAYYGRNLDALDECVCDLPVPDTGGMALALTRFDAYANGPGAIAKAAGRREAEIVLDALTRASRHFLMTGRRLLTLVQTDDARSRFDGLGCVSAAWNRREWLDKNRGI